MTPLANLLTASIELQQRQRWEGACKLLIESLLHQAEKVQSMINVAMWQLSDGPGGREVFRMMAEENRITSTELADVESRVSEVFEAWPEGRG